MIKEAVGGKKILIIDDEQDICFLLGRQLQQHQYVVKDAQSLAAGCNIYKEYTPDILILDINLPDGNGAENTDKFKKINSKALIILMSADNDQLNNSFTNYNANAFLKKPFTVNQLLEVIQKIT